MIDKMAPRPLMESNLDTEMTAGDDDDDDEPMTMQKRLLKLAGHDPVIRILFFFSQWNFVKCVLSIFFDF